MSDSLKRLQKDLQSYHKKYGEYPSEFLVRMTNKMVKLPIQTKGEIG